MSARRWAAMASGLACALALACSRGESSPPSPPASPPAPVSAAPANGLGPIDPAPYRAEIEATEAVLYSTDSLDDTGRKALSRTLLELHNAIVFRDTSAAARETSRRLFFFSAQVDAEPEPKDSNAELEVMRGVWEKIRAEQFTPVAWFRASAP